MKHIKLFEAWDESQYSDLPEANAIPVGDISQPGEVVFAFTFDTDAAVAIMDKEDPMLPQVLEVANQLMSAEDMEGLSVLEVFEEPGVAFVGQNANGELDAHGPEADFSALQDRYWIDAMVPTDLQHEMPEIQGWVSSLKKGVITHIDSLHHGGYPKHLTAEEFIEYLRSMLAEQV